MAQLRRHHPWAPFHFYFYQHPPPTPHHLVSPLSPPCVECGHVSRPLQFCCKSHDDPGNIDRGEAEPTPQWLLLERRHLQKQRKPCVSISSPRFCFQNDSLVTCFLWSRLGGLCALTKGCWASMNQRAMPAATFVASLPPGGFGGRAKIILQASQPQALMCAFTSCPIGDVPARRFPLGCVHEELLPVPLSCSRGFLVPVCDNASCGHAGHDMSPSLRDCE